MSDTSDGSSPAARGAQDTLTGSPRPRSGVLSRLKSVFSPDLSSSIAEDPHPATISQANGTSGPVGLGNLRRMRVEDVAIPRAEIVAVPSDIALDELVETFRESGMSRLPVYRNTLDTPLGIIHLKDLALRYGFNGTPGKFSLRGMLRPLLFAPPSMPIGVLLQKMQSDRMHMALVIDEYGGTDGLVTIEDLIEQVIGEIEDEHDEPEDALWSRERPGCFLIQARAPLDELEAELGLKLREDEDGEEIDTLGGLVFKLSGRVPARGEVVPHSSGTEFEIVDADARRIKRVRVRLDGPRTSVKTAS
ncbi:MAG: hemolysin family protein [Dinoroseobacter sp.]|nr:hemolysin family protein [Dinoroseobacter sp.]MDJ0994469.1 hemolysin family protein [Dinoroseobacter sp.]